MREKMTDKQIKDAALLLRDAETDREAMKRIMVRLAHDAGDNAMDVLYRARGSIPVGILGFFECAWDDCAYLNFFEKIGEVSFGPLPSEIVDMPLDEANKNLTAIEETLAARGILIALVPELPVAHRLHYVMALRTMIGELAFQGSGFVHFDGCDGTCVKCAQRQWCEVAKSNGESD